MHEPKKPVMVIMAGGTGGHVFPALATAEKLRELGIDVHWLGTTRGIESRLVPEAGISINYLTISGVRGMGITGWFTAPYKLFCSVRESMIVLRQLKPVCVLGMGGFASAPGGVAAKLLGIPLVIHEQNAIAGSTNTMLSLFATKVLQAFDNAFSGRNKGEVVGNPIRASIEGVRQHRDHADESAVKHVLVLGGSQGAQALNNIVPGALNKVGEEFDIDVLHQSGEKGFSATSLAYQNRPNVKVESFISDMASAYAWADIVICRSGALTVSELAAAGLPSILVPFPFAIDDHQTANAKILVDKGAAILMPQDQMSESSLCRVLTNMLRKPSALPTMSDCALSAARLGSSERVANVCMEMKLEY